MSAVISDAAFEHDMWCLHMGLGELRTYGDWHKEDPTKPLIEMIREMTKLREEAEEEANRRAVEDWAWEEEEAQRKEEAQKALIPCEFCGSVQSHDVCDICYSTLARYEDLSCAHCATSYTGYMTADWINPCASCHPQYIADYRYVEEERTREAINDNEVAAWYRALPLFAEED